MNPVRARQLDDGPVAPCLRRAKLLIAASATLALNDAPCFLRVCFMSCSRAIGASYGQGPTLTNCLVFGVQLTPSNPQACPLQPRARNSLDELQTCYPSSRSNLLPIHRSVHPQSGRVEGREEDKMRRSEVPSGVWLELKVA